MKQTTAILKRLAMSEFANDEATVSLDGQPIGRIVRERPGFYGSWLNGHVAGGGKNTTNALHAIACRLAEANA